LNTRIHKSKKSSRRPSLKPRKTPSQGRSVETVSVILEAAARILEERAGVSIGSLYQYFPGKDALTVALIEQESNVLLAEVSAAPSERYFRTALNRMIHAAVEHQMRRPRLARLLDFEEARLPVRARNLRVSSVIHDALLLLFRRNDAPSIGDLETVAFDVLAIVRGILDAAGERKEADAFQLECRVKRAVFGYLKASK
jgi:AcrR family transcriptional regulator